MRTPPSSISILSFYLYLSSSLLLLLSLSQLLNFHILTWNGIGVEARDAKARGGLGSRTTVRNGMGEILVDEESQQQQLGGGEGGEPLLEVGFTKHQIRLVDSIEQDVSHRSAEIIAIEKSIVELAEIFKDMAMLLSDQGTILDRIDYNIEHTHHNVELALREIIDAETYQKKTGFKLCMVLLLMVIIGLIIVVAVRIFI